MNHVANFFAGLFPCNCVPPLVCGLKGEPLPTPFAKPRGVANSSPRVNCLWGFLNAVAGVALLVANPVRFGFNSIFLALLSGALLMGVYLSRHFGKVRSNNHDR